MWTLLALAELAPNAADRLRFRNAAEVHQSIGMERHHRLKGNFPNYDHWVPQFAVYAMTSDFD